MIIQRRSFLIGLGSLIAAPAIVRAESIMPIRSLPLITKRIIPFVRSYYYEDRILVPDLVFPGDVTYTSWRYEKAPSQ